MFCEKRRGSPGNCRGIPGRNKELGSHHEDSTKTEQLFMGTKINKKWSAALPVSMSNKIFCFLLQVSK
jgi:hypothetical protein